MKPKEPSMIDQGRVFEEFLFATHRDRALYIRTLRCNRRQWLKDNPGAWRLIEEPEVSLQDPAETEEAVEAAAAGPSSHTSSPGLRDDGEGNAGSVDKSTASPSPPNPPALAVEPPIAAANAPSIQDEITIGPRRYVSTQLFASMQRISSRKLSRLCAAGKVPPRIKIGKKVYFEVL